MKAIFHSVADYISNLPKAVVVTALTLLSSALMLLMGPLQDTGDDAILAWQLARGDGSFAAFILPYLSNTLSFLYKIGPQIPWWTIFLFSGGVILLALLYALAISCHKRGTRFLLCLFSFAGVWICVIKTLNFTRTAFALSLAGMLFILIGISRGKKTTYPLGIFLVFIGLSIRKNAAYLVLPFFLLLLVAKVGKESAFNLRKWGRCILKRKYVFPVLGMVGVIFLLNMGNTLYSKLHPAYAEYVLYNRVRASIVDYAGEYPSWNEGKDAYIAAGLTNKNDWDLLTDSAFISDKNVYSLETLENLAALRNADSNTGERLVNAVKRNYWAALDSSITPLCISALALGFLFFGWRVLIPVVFSFGGAGVMMLWVAYQGRMMLRVWEPTVFCALITATLLCALLLPVRTQKDRYRSIGIYAAALAAIALCLSKDLSQLKLPKADTDRDPVMVERTALMAADPENLYILSSGLIHDPPTPAPFGLWEASGANMPENYFALSNWDCIHPYNLSHLQNEGIENPVTALLERTDVKSDYDSRISRYLMTHYGQNISTTAVGFFADGLPIVQYTKPLEMETAEPSDVYTGTISDYEIVNFCDADWLRLTGQVSGSFSAYYCNLRIGQREITCRLTPDQNGWFDSYVLLHDRKTTRETTREIAWEALDFLARDAAGTLWMAAS